MSMPTIQEVATAAPYTLKKLTDVKDSAPQFGLGEFQEARFAGKDLDAKDTGVAHERIKPNQRLPFGHVHEIVELGLLDALRVAPTVTRGFEAGPDGLEMLAFGPHHKGDGEIIQGWWSD